jgi:hypothetical protein
MKKNIKILLYYFSLKSLYNLGGNSFYKCQSQNVLAIKNAPTSPNSAPKW